MINKNNWKKIEAVREIDRPNAEDFICHCFDYFTELKGDRTYRDDQAVIGGIGRINEQFFTIVGIRRGKNIKENVSYNFGMPHPEGYRKSLRLIRQAEKFKRPVICLVDTPGASCDSDSEERRISEAIARNLFELSSVGVPVLSIIIGSGNSGGALALAIANEVWIAEDAYYSVISPEGFASIVWKDSELKKKASEIMEVFPKQLYDLEIVEKIIPIFSDGERNSSNFAYLREKLILFANEYLSLSEQEIINHRYLRYRKF